MFITKLPLEQADDFIRPSLTDIKRQSSFDVFDDSEKYVNMIKSEMKLDNDDSSKLESKVSWHLVNVINMSLGL